MGMLDNIRNFFRGSNNNTPVVQEDKYRKSMLATEIVSLVDRIQRINSFDSSIWNLSDVSSYELQKRSLAELERLESSLQSKLSELTIQKQRRNEERQPLEATKWTGQRPQNMTAHDFDRFQRDEER